MPKKQKIKLSRLNIAFMVAIIGLFAVNVFTYFSLTQRILNVENASGYYDVMLRVQYDSLRSCYEEKINPCKDYDRYNKLLNTPPPKAPPLFMIGK